MQTQQNHVTDTTLSYLTLRKLLGYLGILLPVFLLIGTKFEVQSSISHFYYTSSSVVFTSILFSFGLFLFCYPGRKKGMEKISDNILTNIGGLFAILTALIPTAICQDGLKACNYATIKSKLTDLYLKEGISTQFIHNEHWIGNIHFVCAALFLALMGWMSFHRFTKGYISIKKKLFYKVCGVIIWLVLIALGIELLTGKYFTSYDIFIGEWIALFFFGLSWLVKGKGLRMLGA